MWSKTEYRYDTMSLKIIAVFASIFLGLSSSSLSGSWLSKWWIQLSWALHTWASLKTRSIVSTVTSSSAMIFPECRRWYVRIDTYIRELKQQRRRRLQKRHLKSEFAPLQTLSRLFHLVCKLRQMLANVFGSWILNNSIKVQEKKRKLLSCVLVLDKTWIQALSRCSRATTAKKCTKKAWCTCKLWSCCFANQTYWFFVVLVAVRVVVA